MTSVNLAGQPVVPQRLDDTKTLALANGMAWLAGRAGVRDAAGWQQFVPLYQEMTRALIDSLSPDPASPVAAALIQQAAAPGCGYLPHLPPAVWQNTVTQSIQSILLNRRDDLAAILTKLADPAFTDSVFTGMMNGTLRPAASPGPLSPGKRQELMVSLLQPVSGKMEPAVHIHASAMGHQRIHQILAQAFNPQGPAATTLSDALQARLPAAPPALIQDFATHWLTWRQVRAQQTADDCLPDGPLVQEAIRLSEESRLRRGMQEPALSAASASPARMPAPRTGSWVEHLMHRVSHMLTGQSQDR